MPRYGAVRTVIARRHLPAWRSRATSETWPWIALMFIFKGSARATSAPLPPAGGIIASWIVHGGRQSHSDD
ncbi:MAG: hypothetical protein ACLQF2_16895, partial [Rhodomicrobium sp.]